ARGARLGCGRGRRTCFGVDLGRRRRHRPACATPHLVASGGGDLGREHRADATVRRLVHRRERQRHDRARPSRRDGLERGACEPLMPTAHGDTVSVRFEMPGAASVAIAGDWNDWSLTPLTSLGNETWAGDLLLKAGTYHFNLRVDGKEWVVPHGVATVPDGL